MIDIRNFGTKLIIKENFHSKLKKEKQIFIDIIKNLQNIDKRTFSLLKEAKIDLTTYDESFYHIIEDLLLLKYGVSKTNIILWYLYDRLDLEGNITKITINNLDDNTAKEYILKNEEELWEFLLKFEE